MTTEPNYTDAQARCECAYTCKFCRGRTGAAGMKDKLRELAERWKGAGCRNGSSHECADELLSILDAEGDGGAVQIPELRIGAPAWPGQMEGKAPPEGWVQLSVNNLPPHPARSVVVSDEDVRDAARYRWLRKYDNADLLAEDVIDEAIAQEKQS